MNSFSNNNKYPLKVGRIIFKVKNIGVTFNRVQINRN